MISLEKIYNLCNGFEVYGRATGIKKLKARGLNEGEAVSYYNIWRRHYLESTRDDLKLSGIFMKRGRNRKRLEECSYKERQKYLEALNKDQLIKIAQAVLK